MKYDFGFIAIGDEITDGDIVNTNTPNFAKHLIKKGFQTGSHISCKDAFDDICSAIEFLKANHKNIIITGGLGPTEDDLTSEAVAKHFDKELELDEPSWLALEKRMMAKYGKITHGTKKQAMFPNGAKVILNPNGTANGFELKFDDNRKIYVLPGPPRECIPMLENIFSKPTATKNIIRKSWNIKEIGESFLAEELEKIKKEYPFVTFKYRLDDGFIELKYFYPNHCPHSEDIISSVELLLKQYL
ncbi:MAG: nicotinamide-nucleotide amidase [Francisella sp.]|jgi:nicotinamide-nucleotide amidase